MLSQCLLPKLPKATFVSWAIDYKKHKSSSQSDGLKEQPLNANPKWRCFQPEITSEKLDVEDKLLTTMPNISDPPLAKCSEITSFPASTHISPNLADTKYPAFSAYSLENLRLKRSGFPRLTVRKTMSWYVMVCLYIGGNKKIYGCFRK